MKDIIIKILKEHNPSLQTQDLTLSTKITDLNLESLDFVEIIFEIENELCIDIEPEDLDQIHTIQDLCDIIQKAKELTDQ